MTDPRFTKLAKLLVTYSTRVKKGEHVLLDMMDVPDEMSVELMRAVRAAGGIPLIDLRHARVTREIQRDTNQAHASLIRDIDLARMSRAELDLAIARLKAEPNEGAMPPPGKRQLDPNARAQLIEYLERNVRSSDDDALLGRAAQLGMMTGGD